MTSLEPRLSPSGGTLRKEGERPAVAQRQTFSQIEKILNSMISRVNKVVDEGKENEVNAFLIDTNSLRLHMRLLRRWRNGSMECTEENLSCVKEFLLQARLRLLKIEEGLIRDKINSTDEFMLMLDDRCNILRDDLEEEVNSLDPDYSSLESHPDELLMREDKVQRMQHSADELSKEVSLLRGQEERIVDGASIELSFGRQTALRSVRFESNPQRNTVLGLVDKIKMTIRLLKEGYHRRMSDQSRTEVDACAEKDVEGLRRQLRKVRRWQQNQIKFCEDDVQDLQLIIKALIKHLGREGREMVSPQSTRLRSWHSMSSVATMDLSLSANWRPLQTLAASSLDLSSADSAYASSPSSESDAPPRHKDKARRKTKITEIKEQEEAKDSLDEDTTFSERLI